METGLQPFLQHGIALYHAVVANGYIYRLFAADQDDEIFSTCYRSIYKVSLQEGIMGGVQGNNNAGEFRTLGFMYCDCIGQDKFRQVCGLIQDFPALKCNLHTLFLAVY